MKKLLFSDQDNVSLNTRDGRDTDHTDGNTYHYSAAAFSSTAFETDEPVSLERLKKAVKKAPGFIYRLKGLVLSTEAPDRA